MSLNFRKNSDINFKANSYSVWFLSCTLASLLCYLAVAWLSRSFGQDTLAADRPTWMVLAALSVAFVIYWLAQVLVLRLPASRPLVIGIIVSSCLFRAVLLPSTPIHEIDIYRYIWDGAVTAEGLNPYQFSPQQVLDATGSNDPHEPDLNHLVQIQNRSDSLAYSLGRIHYGDLPSPYPMVSQWVFALAAKLTPDAAAPDVRLMIMKGLLVLFDVATLLLVVLLLHETGRHLGWSLAFGWCPLVLKEIANSGHLDSIAVFFTTLAVWLLVKTCRRMTDSSQPAKIGAAMGIGVVLALAIGAKLYPMVLLPLFAILWWRRFGFGSSISGLLVVVAISFLLLKPLLMDSSQREGVGAFLKHWEMNDLVFMVVLENLRPQAEVEAKSLPWFVAIPDDWSRAIVVRWAKLVRWLRQDLLGLLPNEVELLQQEPLDSKQSIRHSSFQLARVLTGALTAAIALWLAIKLTVAEQTPADWCRAAMLTLAWFWLLCPTQNPWYWCWVMPLLPFARYRAWHAIAACSMLYYLRFWLRTHFPEPPVVGIRYDGENFYYFVIVWIEYAPCLIWLFIEWFKDFRNTSGD